MKNRVYNALITEEEGGFVALNLDYDVASQGDTREEALDNLREALELYLEEVKGDKSVKSATSVITTFSL
ncbi:MAG: type II toxin-antitoxin system HicB family antitoxin [bacterium]|nr:type II toxin-antitoxin system HicB family antitoxin [bacterium]